MTYHVSISCPSLSEDAVQVLGLVERLDTPSKVGVQQSTHKIDGAGVRGEREQGVQSVEVLFLHPFREAERVLTSAS